MSKIGLFIMAYGTPSSPEAIEPYYTRIRHGRAPSPEQLADLTRRYEAIGGISPLKERTDAQVTGITAALDALAPGRFDVRFGSKYEAPMIEEVAASFVADGVTEIVGLALAPHSSSMSTSQYHSRAREALGDGVTYHAIESWWEAPGFLDLIAARVLEARDHLPAELREDALVLFSAHSLPQRILEIGDTYPDQLAESARRAAAIGGLTHTGLAWQSAGRTPEPWLGPDILDVLRQLAADGVKAVISCPVGFISDHLEVLFDVDIEAQAVAKDVGITLVRTRSLNDDVTLCSILATTVLGTVEA